MKNYKKMIADVRRAAAAGLHARESQVMRDALHQIEREIANAKDTNELFELGRQQEELYNMASALGLDI